MEVDQSESDVYPGQLLLANQDEMQSGSGTYIYLGKVYSQFNGTMKIERAKASGDMDRVTVEPRIQENGPEIDEFLGRVDSFAPESGQLVYAKVTKVEDRFAKLDIVAVADQPVNTTFVGIILQENTRDFDKSNIEMHNCFRPGDIVKAKVSAGVGGGTSRDQSVLLTTAEEDLGVVFARSPHTGALMVPRSWTEFECVQTRTKHKRKVAKVSN